MATATVADEVQSKVKELDPHLSVHEALETVTVKVSDDDILVEDEELLLESFLDMLTRLEETDLAEAVSAALYTFPPPCTCA